MQNINGENMPWGDVEANEFLVPKGKVMLEFTNVKTGRVRRYYVDNMVVDTGKQAIADALRGTIADNRGVITYCALGTGIVAPVESNTTLGTELFRKLISVRSVSGNVATFRTFFTTAEGNGALKEAGLFGGTADGTANSGTLFCRVLINRTKTVNDTLTLSWSVTIG